MASVSVTPLVSRWGVHKSLISSKNHRVAFCQQLSSTGMLIAKKPMRPIKRSMSTDAQRGTGNHHSNVWDDDVIHSLSTPYAAPPYRERAETLIEDIKHLFLSHMNDSCTDGADDLIKRLQMVDIMECLGIDRHFQTEIKVALDYVYSCWNKRGIGSGSRDSLSKELESSTLGFRALRMHRYNVSSGQID
eukprot:PITA_03494